jgi:hypothetical protein
MPASRSLPALFIWAIGLTGLAHGWISTESQTLQQNPSTPGHRSESQSIDGPITSCLFDFQRGEVPDCIRQTADGKLFVSQQVLKILHFDSYGLAPVRSGKGGWMYVSRTGKVLISGVPNMDNWADSFHDGLVRVVRNDRYGFANRRGQIVISAKYDGAMNFEKGKAKVCNHCESKCVDHDCEYLVFSGGEWFQINTKGNVVAQIKPDN